MEESLPWFLDVDREGRDSLVHMCKMSCLEPFIDQSACVFEEPSNMHDIVIRMEKNFARVFDAV